MAEGGEEQLAIEVIAKLNALEKQMAKASGITAKAYREMSQGSRRATRQMEDDAIRSTARINQALASTSARIGVYSKAAMASVGGLTAALGVGEVAAYADAWTEAGNKIRAAAASTGVQVRSLDQLKDGANAARASLEDYVDLYARLVRSASGVAKSEQEIALATDIVAKAFKAGGASASEQAAGILQLGQALGSGVLQGDELRSLRENAPILAQAIADEFGVTIAQLKDLGAEGKLTSDRVFRAIINAQKPIEAQFRAKNSTIKDAMTRINNEFTAYIGHADSSAGASAKLVEALQFLADNFKDTADAIVQFATIIISALAGRAILGFVAGIGNAVIALGTLLTAFRAGTLAAGAFTTALGPIGLLVGAASAAIFLLSDSASAAEKAMIDAEGAIHQHAAALDVARKSSEGYTASLRNQIAMQMEAVKAASIAHDAEITLAFDRAMAFRKMTKDMTGTEMRFAPLEYDADVKLAQGKALYRQYQLLAAQLAEVDKNQKPTSGGGSGGGVSVGSKGGGSDSDVFAREVEQIERRTTAVLAEADAQRAVNPLVDDYGFAVEKAAAQQDLLNAAQEAGLIKTADMKSATPELRNQIDALSTAYAQASAEAQQLAEEQDKARDAFQFSKDTQRSALGDLKDALSDGKLDWQEMGDVAINTLDRITDKILDDLVDAFNQVGGKGGGGFLSMLFGGGGFLPIGRQANIAASGSIGLFAKGGISDEPAIFAEAGPEAAVPLPDGRRIPVDLRGAAPEGSEPREILLRVITEEGPMFRTTIRSESENVSTSMLNQYQRNRRELNRIGGNPDD
ncbi:tape measure protein [Ensifer sp. PDNC004]|uniref:tape measure protein n=1 Tax=Ensifer sp. PDNC004 TaxID=2811423 RepID=UPI0019643625|nr:tape measure protein [Ensifer sp. PDNC004]QRY66554.1 tape measure protein [Ensifer sp. PDNC004]